MTVQSEISELSCQKKSDKSLLAELSSRLEETSLQWSLTCLARQEFFNALINDQCSDGLFEAFSLCALQVGSRGLTGLPAAPLAVRVLRNGGDFAARMEVATDTTKREDVAICFPVKVRNLLCKFDH
jgi:hypothetical protein